MESNRAPAHAPIPQFAGIESPHVSARRDVWLLALLTFAAIPILHHPE